jgi:uncharacterized protein (TIGR03083 family)
MDSDDLWRTIDVQRAQLADLITEFTPDEWAAQSLCTEWTVRDVVAHLTLAQTRVWPALRAAARARGNFDRMIRDTALRQARLPVEEYPRLLRAMLGSRLRAPFISEVEPLIDVLVHAQDITRALGRSYPTPPEPARVAVDRVWTMGFPFRARRRFAGLQLVATDIDWEVGAGTRAEAPIGAWLLLLTGRPAALPELNAPAASLVASRFPTASVELGRRSA